MKQIPVCVSKHYTVYIENGILAALGQHLRQHSIGENVCIVSDSNVWPLYGQLVQNSLTAAGFAVVVFQIPAGESSKNAANYLALLQFLTDHHISRSDCILALGGGVVGDLAGFTAASYLRGIPYVQAPTSLLAMVDSSIGGKTGIDLPAGKNLCGAIYHPQAVYCDPDVLDTLPQECFTDGCAEIIKYAILEDSGLFEHLENTGLGFNRQTVITRCVEQKAALIAQDEFDRGYRMMLNLGHTIGHSIEACSCFTVSHGKAVAIGIATVCRASNCRDTQRILSLLRSFSLPTATSYPAEKLHPYILSDKKRSADTIRWILPRRIGQCEIVPMPIGQIQPFIEEGI